MTSPNWGGRRMVDIAVVIVTWNNRHLIADCLSTLQADLATSGLIGQVYVVDSASSDGTADYIRENFPDVDLYASPDNLGFGRGNNHAIKRIMASQNLPKAVYLLNPDTITHEGATRILYETLFDNPKTGMVGAQLFYEDGSFQHGAFGFPDWRQVWAEFFPMRGRWREGRFNGRYPQALYDGNKPFPVDFTLGATMMLRTEVIAQTGMFDETFFMYCEEVDWAWRIHKAGWDVLCAPTAHITHLSGKSTGQIRAQSQIHLWTSRLTLFKRYLPTWQNTFIRLMIRVGMAGKIRQIKADSALSPDQKKALIGAYKTIQGLAKSS
ncbi:MAG: glycosyltransferase family 2 protein [bacterium]|nr:glycosyltransferase family 2 protein [bacterium]